MIGSTISHYRILEKLGGGGMGIVYKAEDTRLKRIVALKFLPPDLTRDPEAKERFVHEAQAASSLQHNNICVIHDIDETPFDSVQADAPPGGQMFIVMEYYEGETLRSKIDGGPLPIDTTLDLAVDIALGLAKAHEHGIIHRDIKPANIMVTADSGAKILDFGLAKLSGRTALTRAGSTLGTLAYMSPEQTRGEAVDRRSDIWSLGAVLYEMVLGKPAFKGDYENVIVYEIANVEPEPVTALRTGVPVDLERIITKALRKSPDERYQHVDEMLVDLKRLRKDSEFTPPTSQAPAQAAPGRPLTTRVLIPAATLLVLVLVFLLIKPLLFEDVLISEPKPVAVIPFVNQTGDRTYDYLREAIPNLLITSLEQSKYLRVMTWERMTDVLKQMGKAEVGLIDKELGFELCRREGIHAIVIGSFVKAGDTFATDVKVLDVGTKDLLKSASARGGGVESILNSQIDELSKEISRGVGLSQQMVDGAPSPIAEVTTSSMDAYNLFLRGRADYERIYISEARRSLEQAVSLDSNFAVAYLWLSRVYSALLDIPKMKQAIERAKALAARAPEKDRLAIEARYARAVERNPQRHLDLLKELVRKYPQEKRFHENLGVIYQQLNQLPEAQAEFERAIQLDPEFPSPINGVAYIYAAQGHYKEAITTLQRYAALSPGEANPYDSMGEIYLKMGDLDASCARYRDAIRAQPTFFSAYKSLAYVSALREDYETCLSYLDSVYARAPSPGLKVDALAWKVLCLNSVGRLREAESTIDRMAVLIERSPGRIFMAPLAWVRTRSALQRGMYGLARQQFASVTQIWSEYNPRTPVTNRTLRRVIQAEICLGEHRLDSARTYLRDALSSLDSLESYKDILTMLAGIFESELLLGEEKHEIGIRVYRQTLVMIPNLGVGWTMPLYNTPTMRDIVPRAFLKLGERDSAITEYEKLLHIDPRSNDRRLINPLYHYRLALVCEESGKTERAVAQYRRFLELWKHADRDRPELIDARKRLEELTRGRTQ